ncbi:MAG TPA: hypothetical protein VMM12_10350 [Longimicrobiales bacterium]|nr:hypothetical protein [Longimicrobiales bacterium]
MSEASRPGPVPPADVVVATGAALLIGWGGVLLLPGLMADWVDAPVAGGACVAVGIFLAVVAGWIDDLALLALALPLAATGGPGEALADTALWVFAMALILGMFEWFMAHGIAQVGVLAAAGLAAPPAAREGVPR